MKYSVEWQEANGNWREFRSFDKSRTAFSHLLALDKRSSITDVPKRIVQNDSIVIAYGRYLPKGTD